jgi:hypothetical protein
MARAFANERVPRRFRAMYAIAERCLMPRAPHSDATPAATITPAILTLFSLPHYFHMMPFRFSFLHFTPTLSFRFFHCRLFRLPRCRFLSSLLIAFAMPPFSFFDATLRCLPLSFDATPPLPLRHFAYVSFFARR